MNSAERAPRQACDLEAIRRALSPVRWRMRLQAALDGAAAAGLPAGAIALAGALAARSGMVRHGGAVLVGVAAVVVAGALAGFLWRLPIERVARRVDEAHGLAGRVAAALEFARRNPPTAFMRAAIADAAAAAAQVAELSRLAAPLRRPRRLASAAALGVAALLALVVRLPAAERVLPAPAHGPRVAAPHRDPLRIDPALLEPERAAAEGLRDEEQAAHDVDLAGVPQGLLDLLRDVQRDSPSRGEAFDRLDVLKRQAEAQQREPDDEPLRAAGEALARAQRTRALGEALSRDDVTQARRELERLQDRPRPERRAAEQAVAAAMRRAASSTADRRSDSASASGPSSAAAGGAASAQGNTASGGGAGGASAGGDGGALDRLSAAMRRRDEARRGERLVDEVRDVMRRSGDGEGTPGVPASRAAVRQVRAQKGDEPPRPRPSGVGDFLARAAGGGASGLPRSDGGRSEGGARGERGSSDGRPEAGPSAAGDRREPAAPFTGATREKSAWGDEHDPNLLGAPSTIEAKRQLVAVAGRGGAPGPTRAETIHRSSRRGFAGEAYRRVFADYTAVADEVMADREVPPGYRFFVERYFRLIRPRERE